MRRPRLPILAALVSTALASLGCTAGLAIREVTWEGRTPTVRWEACVVEEYLGYDTPEFRASITAVTYDLRLFRNTDGSLVYRRDRLPAPEHTIRAPLEPDAVYRVTMRPRYHLGVQERVGEWSRRIADAGERPLFATPLDRLTALRTPR